MTIIFGRKKSQYSRRNRKQNVLKIGIQQGNKKKIFKRKKIPIFEKKQKTKFIENQDITRN